MKPYPAEIQNWKSKNNAAILHWNEYNYNYIRMEYKPCITACENVCSTLFCEFTNSRVYYVYTSKADPIFFISFRFVLLYTAWRRGEWIPFLFETLPFSPSPQFLKSIALQFLVFSTNWWFIVYCLLLSVFPTTVGICVVVIVATDFFSTFDILYWLIVTVRHTTTHAHTHVHCTLQLNSVHYAFQTHIFS